MWGRCSRPAFADTNPSRHPAIPAPPTPSSNWLAELTLECPQLARIRALWCRFCASIRRRRSYVGATMGAMAEPRIRLSEPTVGEEEAAAAARAVRDGHLVFGPDLPAFEAALAAGGGGRRRRGDRHRDRGAPPGARRPPGSARATRSGSSDLTFIASVNAVSYCGARVVARRQRAALVEPGPRGRRSPRSSAGPQPASRCRRRSCRSTCSATRPTSHRSSRSPPSTASRSWRTRPSPSDHVARRRARRPCAGERRRLRHLLVQLQQADLHRRRRDARRARPEAARPGPPSRHAGEDPGLRLPPRRDRLQRPAVATSPLRSA